MMIVSPLAAEDLAALRGEGLHPSDEDVIRLHALACRLAEGPDQTAVGFPRFARAGGVVFHQPTVAAAEWFAFARDFAADDLAREWMFAFACANGRRVRFLDELRDPDGIQCALGKFLGAFAGTLDEMRRAVNFAVAGYDSPRPDLTPLAAEKAAAEKAARLSPREESDFASLHAELAEAAVATGFTYDDLMRQTPSALRAMIYAARVQAGERFSPSVQRAHADYLATLAAIRARLVREKNGDAAQCPQTP